MVLLVSLFLVLLLIAAGKEWIRKHNSLCYALCAAISVLVVILVWSGSAREMTGAGAVLANVFLQGGLAGAMFIAVMSVGAAPDRSVFRRAVLPIRGPLSIMGAILTLGHNVAFGRTYFVRLFTRTSQLRMNVLLAALCSLAMLAIMVPLTVTSFLCVRKRMQPKRWKRLQRMAYVFYALMYVHVMLLNVTGAREGKAAAILNIALYSLVFLGYAGLRMGKALRKRGREGWSAAAQMGCVAMLVGILVWTFAPFHPVEAAAAYEETARWADGKYKGAAIGYNGRLTVSVVIKDGCLSKIVCTGHVEDEPYLTDAVDGVFGAMMKNNTTIVDTVSGATTTSDALIAAVRQALESAEDKGKT